MQDATTLERRNGQATQKPDNCTTIEDLGSHIQKIAALLNAAINTGADERQDEAWLVGIAHDEAQLARARYMQWALPEGDAE